MKKNKNTEKLIKDIYTSKMKLTTTSDLDKRILENSMNTLEKVMTQKPTPIQWNLRLRIPQIAALVIVLSAICLFTVSDRTEIEQTKQVVVKDKTPGELMSVISLSAVFRDGGMQAIEEQFKKAEKKTKPGQKKSLTLENLICELNGC